MIYIWINGNTTTCQSPTSLNLNFFLKIFVKVHQAKTKKAAELRQSIFLEKKKSHERELWFFEFAVFMWFGNWHFKRKEKFQFFYEQFGDAIGTEMK